MRSTESPVSGFKLEDLEISQSFHLMVIRLSQVVLEECF